MNETIEEVFCPKPFPGFDGFNTPKISQGYLQPYENNFKKYRKQVKMFCELGVSHGASIICWKKYFPNAHIVGIDNNAGSCVNWEESARRHLGNKCKDISVEIGDAMDKDFLNSVAKKYGGFDIILDDCSHLGIQMKTSFETLWQHARLMYAVEDLQTQLNPNYIQDGNFIDYLQTLVDKQLGLEDIKNNTVLTSNKKTISEIEFDNYIVFIKKVK